MINRVALGDWAAGIDRVGHTSPAHTAQCAPCCKATLTHLVPRTDIRLTGVHHARGCTIGHSPPIVNQHLTPRARGDRPNRLGPTSATRRHHRAPDQSPRVQSRTIRSRFTVFFFFPQNTGLQIRVSDRERDIQYCTVNGISI